MNAAAIKEAFKRVREGRSPEFVICDPALRAAFLAAARRIGERGSDAELNASLMNLRKQGKLRDTPTTRRKAPDPNLNRYQNAVLNAARLIERQFGQTVDNVLCDPNMRAQFDALIQFLARSRNVSF